MHCVAGDGVGILVGAVISSLLHLPVITEVIVEYVLGFGFGWTIFQALFMRDTAGGSYSRSLKMTFVPELLSMNFLMMGMVPTKTVLSKFVVSDGNPMTPYFWFVMSMALLVGFVISYPINWWLVANHLKHGMMTVGPGHADAGHDRTADATISGTTHEGPLSSQETPKPPVPMAMQAPRPPVPVMALLSFLALAAGASIAFLT
jgi:hypothetical protein